jgi:hypothetical protein
MEAINTEGHANFKTILKVVKDAKYKIVVEISSFHFCSCTLTTIGLFITLKKFCKYFRTDLKSA